MQTWKKVNEGLQEKPIQRNPSLTPKIPEKSLNKAENSDQALSIIFLSCKGIGQQRNFQIMLILNPKTFNLSLTCLSTCLVLIMRYYPVRSN